MNIDLSNTFDTMGALAGIFLWMIFGYTSVLLNCDLQRFVRMHPLSMHLVGIVAFFFLFTVLDSNNNTNLLNIWAKTLIVYALFICTTKSKWYFVIPVLVLLLIDQSIKMHLQYEQKNKLTDDKSQAFYTDTRKYLNILTYCIIFAGTIEYMHLQHLEYKSQFSLWKFFVGYTQCKK